MRELSLNVMDIVQNSISAKSSLVEIALRYNTSTSTLDVQITDNGAGMSQEQLRQVQSPFYTTRSTRKVGLGVPLFKMASEMTGGSFSIQSQLGTGTTVTARFNTGHIDMTPMGDIAGTILLLIACNPTMDFVYEKAVDQKSFRLDTRELRDTLGEAVPLSNPDVVEWVRDFLNEQEQLLL